MSNNRRKLIKNMLAGSAAIAATPLLGLQSIKDDRLPLKGNIKHSVCRWCFGDMPLEQLCVAVKEMGLIGIDLVGPKDWAILKQHQLISTMCNGAEISLTKGWNNPQYHAQLIKNYTEHIELVAAAGYTNLICFSGNREGMADEVGLQNCADGLKKIMALAEKKGVVIHMELLNSKIDHKDYMCDKTPWGVELCKRIGSPNFKLLYDIYHMQIDEGDVIRTIQNYHDYIGHYHTAGVPGRHEIDESQELFYPAIMRAILATGFKNFVSQEFIPAQPNKMESLRKAIQICDI